MPYKVSSLLIKPAGPDCNIACRYCFYYDKKELFSQTPTHRMTLSTLESIIEQHLSLAGEHTAIGFQGGEPTLCGLDFFTETINFINKHKKPGQQCSVAIQTNGILLDENWAKFFRENNILVGLSVDGPEDMHNTYRLDRGKKGTHEKVASVMQMLKENNVDFNTLTVITKANVGRGTELVKYFREHGSSYMQFIPCVESLGGEIADFSPTPYEYADFLIEVFDVWYNEGFPQFYVRMFDEMLISFVEYNPISCYFAPSCTANLVVEHDGSIFPCDFFVENEWKLGSIKENSIDEISENTKLTQFIERKRVLDDKCKSCQWKALCFGDCPKYRLSDTGERINSSYFCEGYKKFFEYAAPKFRDLKKRFVNDKQNPKHSYWNHLEKSLERNSPCPCGSGLKFKKCCGPIKSV